jgi:hypothetical protein
LNRSAALAAVVPAVLALATPAKAVEAEVDATSAAQAYAFSSPWGAPSISRRRFLQTLALGVYHLEGGQPEPGAGELSVKVRLRLDADAGVLTEERTYSATSDRFVPDLQLAPLDVMYAYVEGRNLAKGWLGFRVGRQYVTDALGWWAFDGALVRLTTPAYIQLEAYGGSEERGSMILATPRFEQNGVWRGDRSGFNPTVYPQFSQDHWAPAYGVALESTGVTWIHGRLDYRKVQNQGTTVVSPFPNPFDGSYATFSGTRTSSERLGYAMDATAWKLGGIKAGLVYDLFNSFFSSYYGNLDLFLGQRLNVGVDYDYYRPTFDGDSIFNYFNHSPLTTITGRLGVDAGDLDFSASGGIRKFVTQGDPDKWDTGSPDATNRDDVAITDVLGSVSGRYRFSSGLVGVHALLEKGDRGHRQGGDISGEQRFMGGRWTALARLSLFDFEDVLRPDRSATSFGYVLGGAFRPSSVAQTGLEWEHDMSPLVGQRFRILAFLNLTVNQ